MPSPDYLGQAVSAWGNITETSLQWLFNGTDSSISILTSLIANGHLIEGAGIEFPSITGSGVTLAELRASISKAFFAFAIPSLWSVAGTRAFILDSGYNCGTRRPGGRVAKHLHYA